METPFVDITLYMPTTLKSSDPAHKEEVFLYNFVSDLYVQKMHGYKPPNTARITIQPAFHKEWERPWQNDSIVSIAPYFNYDEYKSLDKNGRYLRTLDVIQESVLQLSDEYKWDRTVFERAYNEVLGTGFVFNIHYAESISEDRKKVAHVSVEKTETTTTLLVNIKTGDAALKAKLFHKRNEFWYDSVYEMAIHSKWWDNNRFGVRSENDNIEVWYSMREADVALLHEGNEIAKADFWTLGFEY